MMNRATRTFPLAILFFATVIPLRAQVPEFKIDMTPGDAIELFTRDVFSDSELPGPFTSGDTIWTDAEVRFKGHSTRYYAKKSYRVKFSSSNLYYGYRKLNFNSMYTDKSFLREKLSWDLFAGMGTLATTAEHARLSVAGDDKGLYVLIPKVDKYLLINNGRQEAPMYDASDLHVGADLTLQPDSLLKLYWEKEIGDETDYSDLAAMISAINTAPDPSFGDTVRAYFDTTSILQWFTGNTLTMMGDSYDKNYLLYRDTSRPAQQWTVIPWDYDLSWGRTGDLAVPYPASLLNDGFAYTFQPLSGPDNVLKDRFMADTALRDGFKNFLANVIATLFNEAHLWPSIDSLADLVRADAASDPERWGTMDDFEEHVAALKYYVTARRNYLLKTFINPPSGEYNTATVTFAGEGVPHHFVAFDGRLLGTLWLSGVSGLDSITVTAHPDSAPPDAPGDGRYVRRWVSVTPHPTTAQFSARFRWAWSDVSSTDNEVGDGVADERLLRAYHFDGSGWFTLPGSVNAYANTVTIDSITEARTGPGTYFAMMLSETYAGTWERLQNNYWERWHDVKFTDSLHGFIVGEHGSFLRTSDGGETWERDSIGSALHFFSTDMAQPSGRIFAAGQGGSFLRSDDTGRSWSDAGPVLTSAMRAVSFDGAEGVAVGDSGMVFETFNGGDSWSEPTTGLTDDFTAVRSVRLDSGVFERHYRVAAGDEVRIFGWSFYPGPVQQFGPISLPVSRTPRAVDIAGTMIWAAGDSGLAAFGAITDTSLTERPLPAAVNLRGITALDAERVFVAGDGGAIYYTADAGMNWYRQHTGDTHDLYSIAFNGAGRGFAVGNGGTILRTDVPGTLTDVRGGADRIADLPAAFRLWQNYPNPFNSATTFDLRLATAGEASLVIYNTLGQEVDRVIGGPMGPGLHSVRWDAGRHPTGVYFARMSVVPGPGAGERLSSVVKLILMR